MAKIRFRRNDNGTRGSSRTVEVEEGSASARILDRSPYWKRLSDSGSESRASGRTRATATETETSTESESESESERSVIADLEKR